MNKHQQLRPTTNAFKKDKRYCNWNHFLNFFLFVYLKVKKDGTNTTKDTVSRGSISTNMWGFVLALLFNCCFRDFPPNPPGVSLHFAPVGVWKNPSQTVSRQVTVQNSCKSKSESRGIRASESHGFPRCEWWLLIEEDLPGKKNIHFCFADFEWWCYFKPNNSSSILC